jgi:hypothetical protein
MRRSTAQLADNVFLFATHTIEHVIIHGWNSLDANAKQLLKQRSLELVAQGADFLSPLARARVWSSDGRHRARSRSPHRQCARVHGRGQHTQGEAGASCVGHCEARLAAGLSRNARLPPSSALTAAFPSPGRALRQRWPDMMEHLLKLGTTSIVALEIVLSIIRNLAGTSPRPRPHHSRKVHILFVAHACRLAGRGDQVVQPEPAAQAPPGAPTGCGPTRRVRPQQTHANPRHACCDACGMQGCSRTFAASSASASLRCSTTRRSRVSVAPRSRRRYARRVHGTTQRRAEKGKVPLIALNAIAALLSFAPPVCVALAAGRAMPRACAKAPARQPRVREPLPGPTVRAHDEPGLLCGARLRGGDALPHSKRAHCACRRARRFLR